MCVGALLGALPIPGITVLPIVSVLSARLSARMFAEMGNFDLPRPESSVPLETENKRVFSIVRDPAI